MCAKSIDLIRTQIVELIYSLDRFTIAELLQLANDIPGDRNTKQKIIEDLLLNNPLSDIFIYYEYFFVKH